MSNKSRNCEGLTEREYDDAADLIEQFQAQCEIAFEDHAVSAKRWVREQMESIRRAADARTSSRSERRPNFPMMDGPPIPLELAEAIWQGYAALFGKGQKLERVGERGGFGWGEVAAFWSKPKAREAITAALAANRHLAKEKA